jgi:PKD repeat protein
LGGIDGFINTTVSGSSTYTITWDNGVSSNSDDITVFTSGSYTITATDDTDATCFATSTILVGAGGQPTIVANTNVNNVCSGDLVTLSGAGGVSYSWDNGVTDNTPTSVVSTTTYTVTGTDIDGCSNTDQITINVVPCSAPGADFSAADSTLCIGDCIDFTDLSVSSASGITSWSWDFGNGRTSSDQNPTNICYLTVGNFTVTLTVTDANGVDTETEVNFIAVVNCSGPIIQFSATDSAICEGDCISYTDLSTSSAGGNELGLGFW